MKMFGALVKGHLEAHCTTSVHFALFQAVLKCALRLWEERGKGKCLFNGDCVKLMTVHTCIKCQLNEAMSRKVNKSRTNTLFFL